MKKIIDVFYSETMDWKIFKRFCLAVLFIMLSGFLLGYMFQPNVTGVMANIGHKMPNLSELSKWDGFIQLVKHNLFSVPGQMLLLSLIPIPFIYFANLAVTSAILGFIFYLPFSPTLAGKISFGEILEGTIIHGIPEIIGFCMFCVGTYKINRAICDRIYNKGRYNLGFKDAIVETIKIYVAYCIPLITMAAFIEAYVTPLLLN